MYRNIKRAMPATKGLVPIEAVQEIVQQMTNPVKKIKPIEADGGAYRSYCFNVYNKKN